MHYLVSFLTHLESCNFFGFKEMSWLFVLSLPFCVFFFMQKAGHRPIIMCEDVGIDDSTNCLLKEDGFLMT